MNQGDQETATSSSADTSPVEWPVEWPVTTLVPGDPMPVLGNATRLDEMREQSAFFRSTGTPDGFWMATRAEEIREILTNPATFSSSATLVTEPEPAYLWIPQMLDPPQHTTWRRLLGPYFSPGNMKRLEDSVQDRCVQLLDGMAERGSCDFMNDFARKFPTSIFLDMFGLPFDDLEKFLHWEHEVLHLGPADDPDGMRALMAMCEAMAYFDDLINIRREAPEDDILSDSLSWEIDGAPIPQDELLSFCLLFFLAGLDTVTTALGYMFWHLATHPSDRQRIVDDPAIIPSAVEELLRLYACVPPSRKIAQDVDLGGCPMKAGEMVYINLSAACRDPRLFEDPTTAILDRSPNPHLAFGLGPHRCLGAALARRELTVALAEWHKRVPDYRLPEGFAVVETGLMHGIQDLSLEWNR